MTMTIKESAQYAQAYLDAKRKPVGVKFFFNREDFMNFPVEQRDRKVTYCNAVQLASKGQKMKLTKENQACGNGAFALNFVDVPEGIKNGKGRFSKGIYTNQEISKSINDEMLFMDQRPFGIAVMPLEDYDQAPDVVIIIGGTYQVMRVLQGYGYHYGYPQNLKTVGLQALCHDLTTRPYRTNDINLTLLCPGTRLVADWEADEAGVGIAWDKWLNTVEGLVETTNPFARDDKKKAIIERLNQLGFDSSKIVLGQNYDTGSYVGGEVEIEH